MFIVTQIIGLYINQHYLAEENNLPYGLEPPQVTDETAVSFLVSLIISFVIAILLVIALMSIKYAWIMRTWFFVVIVLGLGITINAFMSKIAYPNSWIIALIVAAILGYFKIFKRDIFVHNVTELLIYPGISAIFVPIFNIWTIIILLIIISLYDIWAVWHSGIMQKMAKFQINKLKLFSGFFVPYADKEARDKIALLKQKYKNSKIPESVIKKKKIKVNLAILGGGDVIFPIIAAGVALKTFSSIWASVFVIIGATIALFYLFLFSKKKKFYPAMPFITAGIFLGLLIAKISLLFL